ncbi:MAG TPA: amidohydrolase family protein [Planctomycetota bacterium]|nr:amidohydrolase family protein [Planctomycetota bacterium]
MPEPKPRKLINVHAHHHHHRDFDARVEEWRRDGAVRTCVACMRDCPERGDRASFTNEDLCPYLEKYPDHVIGLAHIRVEGPVEGADAVTRWHDEGFAGLKIIDPCAPYDDERFFPIYERAEELGMPILFHTGWLGGIPGTASYARSHSEYMRPWHLEHVARRFHTLKIIGAHLGHPHFTEALQLVRSMENVYFDFSGGGGTKTWVSDLKRHLAPFPGADWDDPEENLALQWFRKFCFATDNPTVRKWHANSEDIMDYLHVPADTREMFYLTNAATLFGIELADAS